MIVVDKHDFSCKISSSLEELIIHVEKESSWNLNTRTLSSLDTLDALEYQFLAFNSQTQTQTQS